MALTSTTFAWLLRVVFVLVVGWVVLRWPRAAGPGLANIVRRLTSVAILIVVALLALVAPLNIEYGWYSSWGDLASSMGNPTPVTAQAVRGAPAAAAVATPVGPGPYAALSTADRDTLPLNLTEAATGGYQDFTVPGPASGYTGTVTLWLPDSYTARTEPARHYPVIEAFHGYPSTPEAFFTGLHLDTAIETAAAAGVLREPIVVIPHWSPNHLDTECVNGNRNQIQMETWVTQDVPRWLYKHFRVPAERSAWATMGYSAGGWCAAMATVLHPDEYATSISFGGYLRPVFGADYVPFDPESPSGARYDLLRRVATTPPPVALWLMSARPDDLSYPSTVAMVDLARPPLSVTPTLVADGGHRLTVWVPYVPQSLEWLGQNTKGFTPQ